MMILCMLMLSGLLTMNSTFVTVETILISDLCFKGSVVHVHIHR